MIACAAVVGPQNNPLFLRTYAPGADGDATRFAAIVHCALDAVEEKVLLRRAPGDVPDLYLGLLCPADEHTVYGYVTNGRAKLILVVDDAAPREDALAAVLKGMHHAYADALACPFYDVGAPLESRAFSAAVDAAVASYG